MNKVIYKYDTDTTLTFSDQVDSGQGKIIEGSFYNETSLLEDELSIDTMTVKVRYERATPSLISFTYGSEVEYYKDDKLYARYYLKDVERNSKYEYTFSLQSAIGLLDDTNHYGGIYSGQTASDIIKDIIGGKITYTEHNIFSKIKVYGWLPVATRRDNLKQLLFAVGGCVKKKDGDVFFSPLNIDNPTVITSDKVYESGKITYDSPASRIEVVEHQFAKVDSTQEKEIYSGGIVGSSFTSPKGYKINDGAIITWDEPYHSITFDGCNLLNNEVDVNYAVVSSSGNATIKGKPYIHSKSIISRDKANYKGKEKVAKVEDATLVSLVNSNSIAEKVMAYYESPNTLSGSIVMSDEKPLDNITIPNQFEEESTGIIKSIDGTFGQQITKGDVEVRLDYDPPPVYGSRELVSIAITTPPTRTSYEAGESFDPTGMVVTAYYDDETSSVVKNYSISPMVLTKDTEEVTITYREVLITKTTTQQVEVKNLLKSIFITNPPDNTDYYAEDFFDPTGMVVKAYYSDGSSKEITDYTYEPAGELSESDETITVSYTEDGITKKAYQDITVGEAPNLVSIAITTPPNKTLYKVGDFFDTTGMIVTATYDNGVSKSVYGYTYQPNGMLEIGDTTITVSYTKGGVTKQASLTIEIYYLIGIEITNNPVKMSYYEGNSFNKAGMVVVANYSNDTSKTLADSDYVVTPEIMVCSNSLLTVSYTERNITVTAPLIVEVTYYPYDYTKSIVIDKGGTYHLSDLGATHRNLRIIAIGGGTGGNGGMDGQAGTAGQSASIAKGSSGSSGTDSGQTSGGQGGLNGTKGTGGLVFAYDIVLDSNDQDIVINIGSGGQGGTKDSYQDQHTDNSIGKAGSATTCAIGDLTISSDEGSRSDEGYTNIFTDEKFAQSGSDGVKGSNGGKGGAGGQNGEKGVDNPPKTGGSAGTYSDTGTKSMFKETGGNAPKVTTTNGAVTTNTNYPITSQHRWLVHTTYGTNNWGKISYAGSYVYIGSQSSSLTKYLKQSDGTYKQVRIYPVSGGYLSGYDSLTSDTWPTSAKTNGTYTNSIRKITITTANTKETYWNFNTGGSGSTQTYISKVTFQTITKTAVFSYDSTTIYYRDAYGAGGGGGASLDNNGGDASSKNGGNGASAVTPTTPTQYGKGGNGGNGGGGGGGGGNAYTSISNNKSWTGVYSSISGGSAGSGGTGANGATGAQGCVIIYFS